MTHIRTDNVASIVICILAVFCSLVSGSIYPASASLFTYAVLVCLFLSLVDNPASAFIRVWPAWLVLGVEILSSLWTVNLNLTVGRIFMTAALAVFAFLAAFSITGNRRDAMLNVLLAVAAAVSIYGIYQFAIGLDKTAQYVLDYGASEMGISDAKARSILEKLEYRRAFSTLMSPNIFAGYLAMVLPVGAAMIIRARLPVVKAAYAVITAVMLAAALLTKSAGGLAAMLSGLAVFIAALYYSRNDQLRNAWRSAAAGIGLLAVIACVAGYVVVKHRTGGFFGIENSVVERANYFEGALNTFAENPIAGQGAGSFPVTYLAKIKPGAGVSRYAHNLPLQTLAETGIIGFTALLSLVAVFYSRCLRLIKANRSTPGLHEAVMAGGTAFIVHNVVDFTWYVWGASLVWWLYFGIVSAVDDDNLQLRPSIDKTIKVAAGILALMFCYKFVLADFAAVYESGAVAVLSEADIRTQSQARSGPVPEEAITKAARAAELKPYDDTYRAFLANLYEGDAYKTGPKSANSAVEQYKEAIRLNPLYPYHYRDLGILYMKLGDKEGAMRMFDEARRRYPADEKLSGYTATPEK